MKAIAITQPGDSDVLQISERPMPVIRHGDVLVKVMAAGVNRPDVAQRKGKYPPPKGASQDVPGLEISGEIAAVGSSVTAWKKGDTVCALTTGRLFTRFSHWQRPLPRIN